MENVKSVIDGECVPIFGCVVDYFGGGILVVYLSSFSLLSLSLSLMKMLGHLPAGRLR